MNTIEETLAWAGIAAALAMIAGLYLGHRVGHQAGYTKSCADRWDYLRNFNAVKQARLAAERAKRDVRGRYIPQARRPF